MRTARLFLCIYLCLVAGYSFAQDYIYATGNPAFAVNIPVENGFINITNGNLHMEFPLATHKQRGALQLDERLVYDSRIWRILPPTSVNGINLNYGFYPSNIPNAPDLQGGWRFVTGAETGTLVYTLAYPSTSYACAGGMGGAQTTTVYNVSWSDPSGTVRDFGSARAIIQDDCAGTYMDTIGPNYASDASGYLLKADANGNPLILDNNGNQVYPQVIDRFGNYWSSDANGNLIDDVGRTPVIVTKNGSVTYYDVLAPNGPISNNGTRVRYTVTTSPVDIFTRFDQPAVSGWAGTFYPVQSIQLPDGSSYSFTYDSYGEMKSVTLPTGGVIQYGWTNFQDSYNNMNRWLTSRTVGSDPATTFTPSVITQCASNGTGCQEKVVVHKPSGDETAYEMTLNNGAWNTKVSVYTGSASGTPIVTTANAYSFQCSGCGSNYITKSSSVTTLDNGLQSQQQYVFDSPWLGKTTAVKGWDFYAGSAPSTPTTETHYVYSGFDLTQEISCNPGEWPGGWITATIYGYTNTASQTTGIPQHGSSNAGGPYLSSVARWLNTTNGTLTTSYSFDDTGTLLSSTDPNGTTTYGHDSTNTYTTSVTAPTLSSGIVLSTGAGYDVSTGALTSTTDANSQPTTYSNFDAFGRAKEIDYPITGAKSTFTFAVNQTSSVQAMTSGQNADTETLFDGFGRQGRVAVWNGQGSNPWYQTDYCYNSLGQLQFQSLSYQGSGWSTAKQCSGSGASYMYDALGRTSTISTPDGTTSYQYTGRAVMVTDVSGVKKITQTDALGRVAAVCEVSSTVYQGESGAPPDCGLDIPGSGYLTTYTYDLANRKTTITQGVQQRIFQTDSLGRTIYTKEPERGETTYSYTYNSTGLQVTRTRPRANQTSASTRTNTVTQYDKVGRALSVSYDDGTPTKTFIYDVSMNWANTTQTNLKGRLSLTSVPVLGNVAESNFSYDAMGRVTGLSECTPSGCNWSPSYKHMTFGYDWAGNLTSWGDGATGTIAYSHSPAGEVTSITNQTYNDANNPSNLVSNVQNGPFGPILYDLGNGDTIQRWYDSMGRLTMQVGCNTPSRTNCYSSQFYGTWFAKTGSRVTTTCETGRCFNYGYDELNRLTLATATTGSSQTYQYSYDRYGNRWPAVSSPSGNNLSYSFNSSTNQIQGLTGASYDAAGNLRNDGLHIYTYDAEGNITQVDSGATAQYTYDALNHRVRTQTSSATYEWTYDYAGRRITGWYQPGDLATQGRIYWGNQRIAYRAWNGRTYFDHQNPVGTERLRTDNTGAVAATYVSAPWGDEYSANEISPQGDGQDNLHFAGLDHDAESNTDHAMFRQYSPTQGRWMSPDPYDGSYDDSDPQSLNRYAYVGNSPLTEMDPTGLDGVGYPGGAGGCLGAAVTLGGNVGADASCAFGFLIHWLAGGPKFKGSLQPRPSNGNWDEQGAYHHGPYSSIASMIGDVGGLSTPGCEFGACGSGFAGPDDIELHHIFPQQFANWFRGHEIDIGKYLLPLAKASHRLRSGNGVHTKAGGDWNGTWERWIEENPTATPQEILQQGTQMLRNFGIGGGRVLSDFIIIVNPCYNHPFASYCNNGGGGGGQI